MACPQQGGGTEKPVAAIPKSIGSRVCVPSRDFTLSELLPIRFNARENNYRIERL